jgi:hypothetical protein
MTGDKKNIRNTTDNSDNFIDIDFATQAIQKNSKILPSAQFHPM